MDCGKLYQDLFEAYKKVTIGKKREEHDAATSTWSSIEADANKDNVVLERQVKEKIVERSLERRKCVVFTKFKLMTSYRGGGGKGPDDD